MPMTFLESEVKESLIKLADSFEKLVNHITEGGGIDGRSTTRIVNDNIRLFNSQLDNSEHGSEIHGEEGW